MSLLFVWVSTLRPRFLGLGREAAGSGFNDFGFGSERLQFSCFSFTDLVLGD